MSYQTVSFASRSLLPGGQTLTSGCGESWMIVTVSRCDSGFGYQLAKRLDSLGYTVFAGCLLADSGGEGSKKLRAECSSRLRTVQIDVTDDGQVQAAVQQVRGQLPTGTNAKQARDAQVGSVKVIIVEPGRFSKVTDIVLPEIYNRLVEAMVDGVTLRNPAHRYLVGANLENYVNNIWLGYFPSLWTDSTERAEKEDDPTPAMLKKAN
uniref:Uncharacterized protein n=1 Tax=Branchiostoma floridae TaxID=7739 RepID=C3Z8S8_BRAFL|eukprot:XP_002595016.1 hypothetical protein BRAFLDRAFT_99636 [Branchiostoma floridae]